MNGNFIYTKQVQTLWKADALPYTTLPNVDES